jgi:hypothetical protein
MRRHKRLFDWCQKPVNPTVLILRRYSVPIVAGVIATALLVTFLLLSSGSFLRTPPTVPDAPIATRMPSPEPTLAPTATSKVPHYLTEEEAIAIAMPYITQFVEENNRSLTNITATFDRYSSCHTDEGIIKRPSWTVIGRLDRSNFTPDDIEYWTVGYEVYIWADNAEISCKQAGCVM